MATETQEAGQGPAAMEVDEGAAPAASAGAAAQEGQPAPPQAQGGEEGAAAAAPAKKEAEGAAPAQEEGKKKEEEEGGKGGEAEKENQPKPQQQQQPAPGKPRVLTHGDLHNLARYNVVVTGARAEVVKSLETLAGMPMPAEGGARITNCRFFLSAPCPFAGERHKELPSFGVRFRITQHCVACVSLVHYWCRGVSEPITLKEQRDLEARKRQAAQRAAQRAGRSQAGAKVAELASRVSRSVCVTAGQFANEHAVFVGVQPDGRATILLRYDILTKEYPAAGLARHSTGTLANYGAAAQAVVDAATLRFVTADELRQHQAAVPTIPIGRTVERITRPEAQMTVNAVLHFVAAGLRGGNPAPMPVAGPRGQATPQAAAQAAAPAPAAAAASAAPAPAPAAPAAGTEAKAEGEAPAKGQKRAAPADEAGAPGAKRAKVEDAAGSEAEKEQATQDAPSDETSGTRSSRRVKQQKEEAAEPKEGGSDGDEEAPLARALERGRGRVVVRVSRAVLPTETGLARVVQPEKRGGSLRVRIPRSAIP